MASDFIIDLSLSPHNGDFMEDDDEPCNLSLRDSDEDEDLRSAQGSPARNLSGASQNLQPVSTGAFSPAIVDISRSSCPGNFLGANKQHLDSPSWSSPALLPSLVTCNGRCCNGSGDHCERGCEKRPLASGEPIALAPCTCKGRTSISIVGKSLCPSPSTSPSPSSRLSPSAGPHHQHHQRGKLDIEHMATKDNGTEQSMGQNEGHIRPSLGYRGKIIGKYRRNHTNAEGPGQFLKNDRDIKRCYNGDRDVNYSDYGQMTRVGFPGLFTKRYKRSQGNMSGGVNGNNSPHNSGLVDVLFQPLLKREARHRDGATSHPDYRMLRSSPNVGQNASSMDSDQISAKLLDSPVFPFHPHQVPQDFCFDGQLVNSALGPLSDMDILAPHQYPSSLFPCSIPPSADDIPPNVLIQFAVHEIDSLSEQLLCERRAHQQTLQQVQHLLIESEGRKNQLEYTQADLRALQLEAQVPARTQMRMHQHQQHQQQNAHHWAGISQKPTEAKQRAMILERQDTARARGLFH